MDGWTDGRMDRWTDGDEMRDAWTCLKTRNFEVLLYVSKGRRVEKFGAGTPKGATKSFTPADY